jgi:hypothetical protein
MKRFRQAAKSFHIYIHDRAPAAPEAGGAP